MLIEDGLITPTQRDEALRLQKAQGGRIGTNLVQLGAIHLEALALALARQKGVPAAQQRHFDAIHPEAVALLAVQLAQKHAAIPLGFTARHPKTIAVAFLDPLKPGAVDEIQRTTGVRVYPVVAPELRIVGYLERLYGIARHPRFLHLESDEHPAPSGASVGDPRSFFDMSKPDLSRSKSSSTILLTEALRVEAEVPKPAPPSQAVPPSRDQTPIISTPVHVSRPTPPLHTIPKLAPVDVSTAARKPASLAATTTAAAPHTVTPAAFTRRPPEVLQRRGEGNDASSRAPTIPGLPSFAEIDALGPTQPDRTPTDKLDPSTLFSEGSNPTPAPSITPPPVSIWSPHWRSSQAAQAGVKAEAASPATHVDLDAAIRAVPADVPAPSAIPQDQDEPAPDAEINLVRDEDVIASPAPIESPPAKAAAPIPWSAAQAVDAMAVAQNRDEVAEAITNYLRATCGVGLVLIVQHEVAMGWKGFGPAIGAEDIDALAIPLAAPSILKTAYDERELYRGAPSRESGALDLQLFERLRAQPPQEVIVVPILIRDRVVNLILGHAADGGALPDRVSMGLGTLARSAAAAYVRLIQEAKKRTSG